MKADKIIDTSIFSYDNEISQKYNLNATSKLWIQPDKTVYKKYFIYNTVTEKNIHNLLLLSEMKRLYKIPELIMPKAICYDDEKVCGYLMQYCEGNTLYNIMQNSSESETVIYYLKKLSETIVRLPKNVFIGDLHLGNVIVNEENLYLIDIDGFSLKNGEKISCPLAAYNEHPLLSSSKYHNKDGSFKISKDSDIACVIWIFVGWLMKTNPFNYTSIEIHNYLSFLEYKGLSKSLIKMIKRTVGNRHNYLVPSIFNSINTEDMNVFSYYEYVKLNSGG